MRMPVCTATTINNAMAREYVAGSKGCAASTACSSERTGRDAGMYRGWWRLLESGDESLRRSEKAVPVERAARTRGCGMNGMTRNIKPALVALGAALFSAVLMGWQ